MINFMDLQVKKILEEFDRIFPPTFLDDDPREPGVMVLKRGKREMFCIRRLTEEEEKIIDILEKLFNKIIYGKHGK
jgi:hypothetical protein